MRRLRRTAMDCKVRYGNEAASVGGLVICSSPPPGSPPSQSVPARFPYSLSLGVPSTLLARANQMIECGVADGSFWHLSAVLTALGNVR